MQKRGIIVVFLLVCMSIAVVAETPFCDSSFIRLVKTQTGEDDFCLRLGEKPQFKFSVWNEGKDIIPFIELTAQQEDSMTSSEVALSHTLEPLTGNRKKSFFVDLVDLGSKGKDAVRYWIAPKYNKDTPACMTRRIYIDSLIDCDTHQSIQNIRDALGETKLSSTLTSAAVNEAALPVNDSALQQSLNTSAALLQQVEEHEALPRTLLAEIRPKKHDGNLIYSVGAALGLAVLFIGGTLVLQFFKKKDEGDDSDEM